MKILLLRFKNLNSLYGEWEINFEDPAYTSNGIFAITGPTGAGKTTILDAICLALYRQTPRQKNISKTVNEVMSQHAWECYAEVLFQTQEGKFLCSWSQRRADKKANGKLQEAKHQIVDFKTKEILASGLKPTEPMVLQKIGMNFEQFTRSVLLAQGEFDKFLKANDAEKSQILEQITGTQIYGQISLEVHNRHSQENQKKSILQQQTQLFPLLLEEDEATLRQAHTAQKTHQKALEDTKKEIESAITWCTDLEDLERQIRENQREIQDWQAQKDDFVPQLKKLERAEQAAKIESVYLMLEKLQHDQQKQQNDLAAASHEKEILEPEVAALKIRSDDALKAYDGQKAECEKMRPIFTQMRTADEELGLQAQALKTLRDQKIISERDYASCESDLKKNQDAQKFAQQETENSTNYLDSHSQDSWLVAGFSGLREKLANLAALQQEVQAQTPKDTPGQLQSQIDECNTQLNNLYQGETLEHYREQHTRLIQEQARIQASSDLLTLRSHLHEGEACPVCGSLEHPYLEKNGVQHINDIGENLRLLNERIKNIESLEHQKKDRMDTQRALQNLQEKISSLKAEIIQQTTPLGILDVSEKDPLSHLPHLEERLSLWQKHEKIQVNFESNLEGLRAAEEVLLKNQETAQSQLAEKMQKLEVCEETYDLAQKAREDKYGKDDPNAQEEALRVLLEKCEANERAARIAYEDKDKAYAAINAQIQTLKEQAIDIQKNLKEKNSEFLDALAQENFAHQADFLESRMDRKQREDLTQKSKDLEARGIKLETHAQSLQERHTQKMLENSSKKSLDELKNELAQLSDQISQQQESLKDLEVKITQNEMNKKSLGDLLPQIAEQDKECQRWDKLHDLIGSSDGKKYRQFTQALTFDVVIYYANKQLKKMSDRYLLIRTPAANKASLDLSVIDQYQADEMRTIKNLSGGESFLMSLALALGLSSMASDQVQVDSLFLDEGFGTLDEQTLQITLDMLASLHQEGKLIGVISHVPGLNESISTQIMVTSHSGGKSILSGNGISRL